MKGCSAVAATVILLACCGVAVAQGFCDNFEGSTFDPFWDVPHPPMLTPVLARDVSHSGNQSVKCTESFGSNVGCGLLHVLPQPTKGRVSVWIYDTSPGSQTRYFLLSAECNGNTDSVCLGIVDWNGSYYHGGFWSSG